MVQLPWSPSTAFFFLCVTLEIKSHVVYIPHQERIISNNNQNYDLRWKRCWLQTEITGFVWNYDFWQRPLLVIWQYIFYLESQHCLSPAWHAAKKPTTPPPWKLYLRGTAAWRFSHMSWVESHTHYSHCMVRWVWFSSSQCIATFTPRDKGNLE